jgi:hypothetical protein
LVYSLNPFFKLSRKLQSTLPHFGDDP